jgi:hypothetical protein
VGDDCAVNISTIVVHCLPITDSPQGPIQFIVPHKASKTFQPYRSGYTICNIWIFACRFMRHPTCMKAYGTEYTGTLSKAKACRENCSEPCEALSEGGRIFKRRICVGVVLQAQTQKSVRLTLSSSPPSFIHCTCALHAQAVYILIQMQLSRLSVVIELSLS